MQTIKATKLITASTMIGGWIGEAFRTHLVPVPFITFTSLNFEYLKLTNRTQDGRRIAIRIIVGLSSGLHTTSWQLPSHPTHVTIEQFSLTLIIVVIVIVGILSERQTGLTTTPTDTELGLQQQTGGTPWRKVSCHRCIKFMGFPRTRHKTVAHFPHQVLHDCIFTRTSRGHIIARGFGFPSQIGFVELVSHTIVGFHKGNSKKGR
jgi:hypothetical protein